MPPARVLPSTSVCTALAWPPAHALTLRVQDCDISDELDELNHEDLMLVEAESTSAGRKARPLCETTAAVHVLTANHIRRSGMTSLLNLRIPEPKAPFMEDGTVVVPLSPRNLGSANTWGGEVALDWLAHARMRGRAEWRPHADWRVVLGSQGLFQDAEPEFGSGILSTPEQVQNAFYLQLAWSH